MDRKSLKRTQLKINYYKDMKYFYNTIYFLRSPQKINLNQQNKPHIGNEKIVYLNYKSLKSKWYTDESVLNNNILNKKEVLFLLDFKENCDSELLSFLFAYHNFQSEFKNPVVILNKSKKNIQNKQNFKSIKYLNTGYYLILKSGIRKNFSLVKPIKLKSKNNSALILGFSILNLLSFIFMSLFGSTVQYVRMSALLESMTYFMNSQPQNARIHAVYNEHFESLEEQTSANIRNKYSDLQRDSSSYEFRGTFNSYFVLGTPDNLIEFDVKFKDIDNDSYKFKTKLINQSVYSNQNRVLMEKIDLEQYLVKNYPHHAPTGGADSVYYLPSNIADEILSISNGNDFQNYSDFIGKLIVVSYKKNNIDFEQIMSINNIFYTSDTPMNVGGVTGSNEYVNHYGNKDRDFGKHMLATIGNFGVSTSSRIHRTFGSVFCFDFFGYNKVLKIMLDRHFSNELKNRNSFLDFSYLNQSIDEFGFNLNEINNFYRENFCFFQESNFLYFSISILLLALSTCLFIIYLKLNNNIFFVRRTKKQTSILYLLICLPFIIFQSLLLLIVKILDHNVFSISLLNVLGSPFSLLITSTYLLCFFVLIRKNKKSDYKIKI